MRGWTEANTRKRPATPRKQASQPNTPETTAEPVMIPKSTPEPPARTRPAVYGSAEWPPPGWRPKPDAPPEAWRFVCHGADDALRQALEETAAAHGARRES